MTKVWILHSGNEYDNATNFGVFSSEEKANVALETFAEFEKCLYVEEFEVDALIELYSKLDDKRHYSLDKRKSFASVPFDEGWHVYSGGLDSFIYDMTSERDKRNFIFQNSCSFHASVWTYSEEEAVKIAARMLEKLGKDDHLYE